VGNIYSERAQRTSNMTSADRLPSYYGSSPPVGSARVGSKNTIEYSELQERLGLYQVFLRLYDNHRGLLDEILGLENVDNHALQVAAPYIQGMVTKNQVSLVTNLIHGKTQATQQPQNTWVIGRDPCRVTFALPDRRLSRCHAAVQYIPGQGFYLTDLGSSNGSYINGEMICQPTRLNDGDRIRLGSLTFTFFLCQSIQTLQPLNPDLLTNLDACTPLSPLAQVQTEAELLENLPASPSSAEFNPLEDTCNFTRNW
jgi:pSer/pThr/pTyr-binding forkhead associated (FHA) protein